MAKETKLPPGYKSVKDSGITIALTGEDLSWLTESTEVKLAEAKLENGTKIFIGSAIRGQLKRIADKLLSRKKEGGDRVNEAFYTEIGQLMLSGSTSVPVCRNARSKEVILYTKNKRKTRTFYIRKKVEGVDAFIKVAVCSKEDEEEVYKKIA